MNILVCAPHCDDECLGMGATISKLSHTGHNVACWFYFSGINCNGIQQEQPKTVSDILGTAYPPFVMPMTLDNASDLLPILDIVRSIENTIAKVNPEVVYIPLMHDLNIDHRRVSEAALVATRPMCNSGIKRVLAYEVPSVTDQALGRFGIFSPNVFEGVDSDSYQHKIEALHAYGCLHKHPHPRSVIGVDSLLVQRGAQVGFDYAEAFELIWERRQGT